MGLGWTGWLLWGAAQAAEPATLRRALRAAEQAAPLEAPAALSAAHAALDDAPPTRARRAARRLAAVEAALPAARSARIQQLLQRGLSDPDVVLEVAALYLDQAAHAEQTAAEAAAICARDPACSLTLVSQDTDPGGAPRRRAVVLYERFLAGQPAHPRADEARYHLAGALHDSGQLSAARRSLNQLIGGDYTGLALLQRGDLSLETGDLFGALADYQSAIRALPGEQQALARYRAAVCLRRLDRRSEAAALLEAVLSEPSGPIRDAAVDLLAVLQSEQP